VLVRPQRRELWQGQKLTFMSAEVHGKPASKLGETLALELQFVRESGSGENAETLTGLLTLNPKDGIWSCAIAIPEPGQWHILPTRNQGVIVADADTEKIVTVKERTFEVKKGGQPALHWQPDLHFWSKGKYESNYTVTLDFDAGEEPEITVEPKWTAEASGSVDLTGAFKLGEIDGSTITLHVLSTDTLPELLGDFEIKAKVGASELRHTVRLDATYNDKWQRIFMWALPFIIGLVLCLALIIWHVNRPKFLDHQLRPIIPGSDFSKVYYLRDLGGRAKTMGPPDVDPMPAEFRLFKKRGDVVVDDQEPHMQVYQNDVQILAAVALQHGDQLSIRASDGLYRYFYFTQDPRPEEMVDQGVALDDEEIVIVDD
jgi:hypothetical protein